MNAHPILSALLVPMAALQQITQVTSDSPHALLVELPSRFISGYSAAVKGEQLTYHSPIPYVDRSLLVRSEQRERYIEWETAPVPHDFEDDSAVFVFMAGIDVNEDRRTFQLFINEEPALQFRNPAATDVDVLRWEGVNGVSAEFRVSEIDKYEDLMGFVFLTVPRRFWQDRRAIRFKVVGESAGRRTWFMVFQEPLSSSALIRNAPVLLRAEGGNQQLLRVDVVYLGESGRFSMTSASGDLDAALSLGHHALQLTVAAVQEPRIVRLALELDGERAGVDFTVNPVRRMDLYLIHHTHLDIGYTHHQDDVERLQWEHLETALQLGEETADLPIGSRFIWNPEGLWAVESYLERHEESERERLLEGIRSGWIALDGMFANLLTGIASSEGLIRSLEAAKRLEATTGVPIESAMVSDIPGFTWGLVPALAQHGIKYLSVGPNFGHRIGHFSDEWGDRPFYWESLSGKERVLTWVSGAGYAWFHTGLGATQLTKRLEEQDVFKYLDRLVEQEYPYDITHMRYNIGSDNGPPDPGLVETVREWNRRYASPRLIISSTAELFRAFEQRYGGELPVYRGDLTGHWEDGAASSARETAAVRRVAEHLVQTEALAAMLGKALTEESVYDAWRQVLLYYEHTWGSWNSISEPESEFTLLQWRTKRQFADSAVTLADRLRAEVLVDRSTGSGEVREIEVLNTLNWERSDIVLIPSEWSALGDVVLDEIGATVPSQRMRSGELAFLAHDIPAWGSRRFTIMPGKLERREGTHIDPLVGTRNIQLGLDSVRGDIASLVYRPADWDYAVAGQGLNQFFYVPGRDPKAAITAGPPHISLVESGPLVWAIEISASAPGTSGISSEVRLYEGIDRLDIINRVDKELIYDPEAVLYRFPFHIPAPEVRLGIPLGSYTVEQDQLPGSCKNYLSLERWADVHNEQLGVTFVSIDAPMVQLGDLRTDAVVAGWAEHLEPSATLWSYVMNNYWETNYRAGQGGLHEFHYALQPHLEFSASAAERFAAGVAQPLVVISVDGDAPAPALPFEASAEHSVVTLLSLNVSDARFVLRLYNPTRSDDVVRFKARDSRSLHLYRSDMRQRQLETEANEVPLSPHHVVTLVVEASGLPGWD
jgi:hypothetical protein